MEEQQARECIINWAKERCADKTPPDVFVIGIHYEAEFDVWDAQLSLSNRPDNLYVTFTEDSMYKHNIQVHQAEY